MALKAGYWGIKKLLSPLKLFKPGELGIDNDALVEDLDPVFFPRSEQAALGAKNFIPKSKKTTASANGIDFTFNADGSVTFSGTSTATAEVAFDLTTDDMLKVGDLPSGLILNGSDSTDEKYCIESIYKTSANAYISDQRSWNGDLKLIIPSNAYYIRIAVLVKPNVTISTPVTVYPMLRIATDTDPTYAPYAMTNKELTDAISNISSGWAYSTDEVNTGQKWIDGNDIYCKTFTADCSGNISTSVSLDGTDFEDLVNAEGVVKITPVSGSVYFDKLDQTHLNNLGTSLDFSYASGLMSITPNTSMLVRIGSNLADDRYVTSVEATITLYYTKAATNQSTRSTKKTTKKTASADTNE